VVIGKKSFGAQKLKENFLTVAAAIMKAKPPTAKGTYVKSLTVSTTMSPGIPMDTLEVISMGG
jgi:large subunit ribosomal protein L1